MLSYRVAYDLIEERAAIMEYDGGMTRTDAQEKSARAHGFATWAEYVEKTQDERH